MCSKCTILYQEDYYHHPLRSDEYIKEAYKDARAGFNYVAYHYRTTSQINLQYHKEEAYCSYAPHPDNPHRKNIKNQILGFFKGLFYLQYVLLYAYKKNNFSVIDLIFSYIEEIKSDIDGAKKISPDFENFKKAFPNLFDVQKPDRLTGDSEVKFSCNNTYSESTSGEKLGFGNDEEISIFLLTNVFFDVFIAGAGGTTGGTTGGVIAGAGIAHRLRLYIKENFSFLRQRMVITAYGIKAGQKESFFNIPVMLFLDFFKASEFASTYSKFEKYIYNKLFTSEGYKYFDQDIDLEHLLSLKLESVRVLKKPKPFIPLVDKLFSRLDEPFIPLHREALNLSGRYIGSGEL